MHVSAVYPCTRASSTRPGDNRVTGIIDPALFSLNLWKSEYGILYNHSPLNDTRPPSVTHPINPSRLTWLPVYCSFLHGLRPGSRIGSSVVESNFRGLPGLETKCTRSLDIFLFVVFHSKHVQNSWYIIIIVQIWVRTLLIPRKCIQAQGDWLINLVIACLRDRQTDV